MCCGCFRTSSVFPVCISTVSIFPSGSSNVSMSSNISTYVVVSRDDGVLDVEHVGWFSRCQVANALTKTYSRFGTSRCVRRCQVSRQSRG